MVAFTPAYEFEIYSGMMCENVDIHTVIYCGATFWEVHVSFAGIKQWHFHLANVSLILAGIKLFSSFGNGGSNREIEKKENKLEMSSGCQDSFRRVIIRPKVAALPNHVLDNKWKVQGRAY